MTSFETELVALVPRLRRYARALTGDPGHADDLVQDTLERGWRKSDRWQAGSDLRAWLFTIMHNTHVNHVRRAIRRGTTVEYDDRHTAQGATQETSQLVGELDEGLATLPVEQREVLLLVALEGLRYEEVAGVLDIPIGTVMSRLSRARERMRRWLDGDQTQTRPLRIVR